MPPPMNVVGSASAHRFGMFCLGAAVLCAASCSSSTPGANTPEDVEPGSSGERSVDDPLPRPLPRYLTLEVRSDGVWIGGEMLQGARLRQALREGAQTVHNQGAAVIFYVADDAAEVLRTVAEAGFSHVVISGLSADGLSGDRVVVGEPEAGAPRVEESTDSAESDQEAAPTSEPARATPPTPTSTEAEEAPPDDVIVKHYGLHIGGGPNDDATREKYLEPIAQRFDALRRCHVLAKNRKLQASFGVDLQLPHDGGRAKI